MVRCKHGIHGNDCYECYPSLDPSETHSALIKVAEYIVDCENNEYDSYVSFCEENGLDPKNIRGKKQRDHVYALALVGLGLEFLKLND